MSFYKQFMLYSGSTVKTITVPPLRCSSPNFDIGMETLASKTCEGSKNRFFKRIFSADSLSCLRDIFFQISSHDYHKGRSGNLKIVHLIHFKAYVVVIYILAEVMPEIVCADPAAAVNVCGHCSVCDLMETVLIDNVQVFGKCFVIIYHTFIISDKSGRLNHFNYSYIN